MADVEALFEEQADEFLKFERIKRPMHRRRDLCAFLMLDSLQPDDDPMFSAATHDEYFLSIDVEKIAPLLTSDIVRDLVRCGLRYDADEECFAFFS